MSLSALCILLGLAVGSPNLLGLLKPKSFSTALRKFPRSLPWGYALMLTATAWFLWNIQQENISDFAPYKRLMLFGFGAVGIGSCVYVKDFLAVRGLAIILLLLAKLMIDTAKWVDSSWRHVIMIWAYLWILIGMWLTISPWRFRDFVNWSLASDRRNQTLCAGRLAFAVFVLALGIFAF